ncbi:J domain-containing protein [Pseudomonas sp. RIT-PI-S]|uniref:J domain-containing protein n=1 Tax=Pseudomonas sp. RIT-PI-S TaxID=3035295 RepID=UPI0021D821DB|nr:J domain-containing protein [Pseudomonas sp. RIT-PI-S]
MPEVPTHYANLRVARNAPPEVIRAAYKALMQKHHPDRNPGNQEAERIVKLLNDAYAVLNDPAQRARHDLWIAKQKESRLRAQLQQLGAPAKAASIGPATRQRWKIVLGLLLAFALGMGLAAQLLTHARPPAAVVWRR